MRQRADSNQARNLGPGAELGKPCILRLGAQEEAPYVIWTVSSSCCELQLRAAGLAAKKFLTVQY